MTHDPPEGVVSFTNGTDEVAYKMLHMIEQYNSLSDLEKEHIKSVYLRNEEDKRRGVEYVMSKILGFYKECLELGSKYVTGMDDEGEVAEVCRLFWNIGIGYFRIDEMSGSILNSRTCYCDASRDRIVFLIWNAFGRITRDLGSFGEETDKTTDLHQHCSRISLQWLETASQIQRDAVTTKIKTASQDSTTASEHTTQPII
ncbi:hypothetical protein Tco_1098711 [Tanacetum coccineum]